MTTVSEFSLFIFDFYLKALANRLFFFIIFFVVFKKPSRFSIEPFITMWFKVISYFYLSSNIFLVFSISLRGIRDKKILGYVQNPGKNVMELYIILSKTLCFFIYEWLKIIGCYSNFVIDKKTRLLV